MTQGNQGGNDPGFDTVITVSLNFNQVYGDIVREREVLQPGPDAMLQVQGSYSRKRCYSQGLMLYYRCRVVQQSERGAIAWARCYTTRCRVVQQGGLLYPRARCYTIGVVQQGGLLYLQTDAIGLEWYSRKSCYTSGQMLCSRCRVVWQEELLYFFPNAILQVQWYSRKSCYTFGQMLYSRCLCNSYTLLHSHFPFSTSCI